MFDGLLLCRAVDRGELLVGYLRGVGTHGIESGYVAPEEELQLSQVDEPVGVVHYRRQEPLVLLVSLELRPPVVPSRHDDAVQSQAVAEDEHVRPEAYLPAALLERLRDDDLELEVHLTVALGHVPEGGGDEGGIKHVAGDHLPVDVADGLHEEELSALSVVHPEGVPVRTGEVVLPERGLPLGKSQPRGYLALSQFSYLSRGATAGKERCRQG